jgi:hypothetical protein
MDELTDRSKLFRSDIFLAKEKKISRSKENFSKFTNNLNSKKSSPIFNKEKTRQDFDKLKEFQSSQNLDNLINPSLISIKTKTLETKNFNDEAVNLPLIDEPLDFQQSISSSCREPSQEKKENNLEKTEKITPNNRSSKKYSEKPILTLMSLNAKEESQIKNKGSITSSVYSSNSSNYKKKKLSDENGYTELKKLTSESENKEKSLKNSISHRSSSRTDSEKSQNEEDKENPENSDSEISKNSENRQSVENQFNNSPTGQIKEDAVFNFLNLVKPSNINPEIDFQGARDDQANKNDILDIQFTDESDDDQTQPLLRLYEKIGKKIVNFFHTRYFSILFTINVVIALFLDSLKRIFFPISWDKGIDIIMASVFLFFIVEISIQFVFEKSYRFSFFFFADVLSVCGLIPELHLFLDTHYDYSAESGDELLHIFLGNSHLSKTVRVTASGSRISRVFSLFNVLGTLSIFQIGNLYKKNVDEFLEKTQMNLFEKKQKEHIRLMRRNTLTVNKISDKISFFKKLHSVVNLSDDEEIDDNSDKKKQKRQVVNPIIIKNFYDYTMKNEIKNRQTLTARNKKKNLVQKMYNYDKYAQNFAQLFKDRNLTEKNTHIKPSNSISMTNNNHLNFSRNEETLYSAKDNYISNNKSPTNSISNNNQTPPTFNVINLNFTNINLTLDDINKLNLANNSSLENIEKETWNNSNIINSNPILNSLKKSFSNSKTYIPHTDNKYFSPNNTRNNPSINLQSSVPVQNNNLSNQNNSHSLTTPTKRFSSNNLNRRKSTLEVMKKLKTIIFEEKEEENENENEKHNHIELKNNQIEVKNNHKIVSEIEEVNMEDPVGLSFTKEKNFSENVVQNSNHSQQSQFFLCECGSGTTPFTPTSSLKPLVGSERNSTFGELNLGFNKRDSFKKQNSSRNSLNFSVNMQRRNSFMPKFTAKRRFSLISKDILSKINVDGLNSQSESVSPAERKRSVFWGFNSDTTNPNFPEGTVKKCEHCGGAEIANPALEESFATYLDEDDESRRSSIDFGGDYNFNFARRVSKLIPSNYENFHRRLSNPISLGDIDSINTLTIKKDSQTLKESKTISTYKPASNKKVHFNLVVETNNLQINTETSENEAEHSITSQAFSNYNSKLNKSNINSHSINQGEESIGPNKDYGCYGFFRHLNTDSDGTRSNLKRTFTDEDSDLTVNNNTPAITYTSSSVMPEEISSPTNFVAKNKEKPKLIRKPTEYVDSNIVKTKKKKFKVYKLKCAKEFEAMTTDQHPRLAIAVSKTTTIRLICLILIILFLLPYLNSSSYSESDLNSYDYLLLLLENYLYHDSSLFIKKLNSSILNQTFLERENMHLISFGFNNNKTMCNFPKICDYFPNSTIFFDKKAFNSTRSHDRVFINLTNIYMVYNTHVENKIESILMIFKTFFITLILFTGAFLFLKDSNKIAVIPLEETYKGIKEIKFSHENFFHDNTFKMKEEKVDEEKFKGIRKSTVITENILNNIYNANLKTQETNILIKHVDVDKEKIEWLIKNNEFMMIQKYYIKLQKMIISIYGFRVFDYIQSTLMIKPKALDDEDKCDWASSTVNSNEMADKINRNPFFRLNGVILTIDICNFTDLLNEHKENATKIVSRLVEICDITSFETFGEVIKVENERIFIFWDQGKSYKVHKYKFQVQEREEPEKRSSIISDENSDSLIPHSLKSYTESLIRENQLYDEENQFEIQNVYSYVKKDQNIKIQVLPELRNKSNLHQNAANLAFITAIKIHSRVLNDDILNPHLLNKNSLLKYINVDIKMSINKGAVYNFILNSTNRMESVYTSNCLKECIKLNKMNRFKLHLIFTDEIFQELHLNFKKFSRDITVVFKPTSPGSLNTTSINNSRSYSLFTRKVLSYDLDFNKHQGKNPYLSQLSIDAEHALIVRKTLIEQFNLGIFDMDKVIRYDLEILYAKLTDSAFLEFFKEGMDYYVLGNYYQAQNFLSKALIFKNNDILTRFILSEMEKKKNV